MIDNSYRTTFGPSTPGAINLVSGQTNGVINLVNPCSAVTTTSDGTITLINDADPTGDMCSTTTGTASNLSGKNIGDLLVGNTLNGTIMAFDPKTGNYVGLLLNSGGTPIAIPGLWGSPDQRMRFITTRESAITSLAFSPP
jgi:hypothetical protein